MNKYFILLLVGVMFFMIVGVNAQVTIGSAKEYNPVTKTVSIKDEASKPLANIELMFNTYSCSSDCFAILKLDIKKDSVNPLSNVIFQDMKDIGRQKAIFYNIQIKKPNEKYHAYDNKESLPSGIYYIKLSGSKNYGDILDWQGTFYNQLVSEFAIWGSIYTYDLYPTSVINSSLWFNTTSSAQGTTNQTANSKITANVILGIDNVVVNSTIATKIFPNYSYLQNISFKTDSYVIGCGNDGSYSFNAKIYLFGNVISALEHHGVACYTPTSEMNVQWNILKNGTKFDVWKSGAYSTTITPTSNQIVGSVYELVGAPGYARWGNVSFYAINYSYTNETLSYSINYPSNNSKLYKNSLLTFNISEITAINNLNYTGIYIDNVLVNSTTISGINNISLISYNLTSLNLGNHNFYAYICDSDNNCQNTTINNFEIQPFSINSVSYNSQAYETGNENFILNLSYNPNDYQLGVITFNYNGTSYSSTQSGTNGNYLFSNSLDIPLTDISGQNKVFYWSISLVNSNGSVYYNTSFYNQSINQIGIGECNATYPVKALNFTAYSQSNQSKIYNFTFKGIFNIFVGNGSVYRNVSFNNETITEKTICMRNNTIYKISGSIQYSKDGYSTSDFHFVNHQISNATENISLYLLEQSKSTSFILYVKGKNSQLPLPNYYITILRYLGSSNVPIIAQITQTDQDGKSIGFFETETVDYEFLIFDPNGIQVFDSGKQKMIPQSTPYSLTFYVGETIPSPFSYFSNVTGLTYTLSYNNNNKIASFLYSDSNSSFEQAYLNIYKLNYSGNDGLICNASLTTPNGVLSCDMTGNLSGSYVARAFITRGGTSYLIDQLSFEIVGYESGNIGLLGAFFIILICGFAFAYHNVAGILSINAGLFFCEIMGLTHIGFIAIFGVVCVSILILIILERG